MKVDAYPIIVGGCIWVTLLDMLIIVNDLQNVIFSITK